MAYAEDLVRLRKRMLDALELGVIDAGSKDMYEATLIQIMNESEKQRQTCVTRAEDLRRQAAIADGQSHAFTQTSSIIYSVLNGYIVGAERQRREDVERAAEIAEKEAAKEAALSEELKTTVVEEESKKRTKK
jgi:hypothetical protein